MLLSLLLALVPMTLSAAPWTGDVENAALAPACLHMAGVYEVPALTGSERFRGLLAELADPAYVPGSPLLEIRISGDGLSRVGKLTGNEVALRVDGEGAASRLFSAENLRCALSDAAPGSDFQLAEADLSALPEARLAELAEYLGGFWDMPLTAEQLRRMRYFMVVDASMVGVAAIFYALPLEKLSPSPESSLPSP